jgi:hypothetical protein
MSGLRSAQVRHVWMMAKLIDFAMARGYELTWGDAYRDPRVFGEAGIAKGYGNASSCHKLRLAVDLNLFIDGEYREDTAAHQPLGEYWESLGGAWGGRWGDANHYSIAWGGVR